VENGVAKAVDQGSDVDPDGYVDRSRRGHILNGPLWWAVQDATHRARRRVVATRTGKSI
jgi:hypothetical protein